MSTDLTALANSVPSIFGSLDDSAVQELSGGIQAGFPVMSFRGRVWRIKAKGEEHIIKDEHGEPRPSVELVLLAANPHLSKIYYEKNYQEGDDSPPRCWSVDGIKPDGQVENPVCATCAACPNNVWGSKITPSGSKVKACSDSKRIAVVPSGDLENKTYGGPMLLRIPAASLQGLLQYNTQLAGRNIPFFAVRTRLSFDLDASYPKLECTPVSMLNDAEAQIVLNHRASPEVARILASVEGGAPPEAVEPTVNAAPVVQEPPAPASTDPAGDPPTPAPRGAAPGAVIDSAGTKFDPEVHAVTDEGVPRYKQDGTFAKKRGRRPAKETAAMPPEPEPQTSVEPAAAAAASDEVDQILGTLGIS